MDPSELEKMNCPHICPKPGQKPAEQTFKEVTKKMFYENPFATAYVPGCIVPREKKVYPAGSPPSYYPQPIDSTSGDILGMGPIGPWASGHVDWTPHAGMTGVRPIVEKYSITRYSTGEWRMNNQRTTDGRITDKGKNFEEKSKKDIAKALKDIADIGDDSNNNLRKRVKDLSSWKKKVESALRAITNEIAKLDEDRAKLKGACKILKLPEAISRECVELRTQRYEPDLVRDDAEQELIKEMAMTVEIKRVFTETLLQAEKQMENLKAAKSAIEFDWSDKQVTLKNDRINLNLTPKSSLLLWHPGVARWTDNSTSLEYWEHYCSESIKNCDEVRQKSEELRSQLMTIIMNGSQDMKIQADRTNEALAETIKATEGMRDKLEETLRDNLQKIVDIEKLIDYLKDCLRDLDEKNKLVMTRLQTRNYNRPNVENCRDKAQYALMAEAKSIKETCDSFKNKVREAEAIRTELMSYRGQLEKDIACKRKSLEIDRDRLTKIRSFMPTPEEFANA